ncbi:MAG: O-antigen ligase family protein [Candidatus Competibacter sp.]|nr:O-antigen ligase family protein [Candidatus Competibacter sp.]
MRFLINSKSKWWSRVAVLWAIYIASVFSFPSSIQNIQNIIWGGGLLVGSSTLYVLSRDFKWRQVPLEVILLTLFLLWALFGGIFAGLSDAFIKYSRQIFQFILILFLLSIVILKSSNIKVFYWAFVVLAIMITLYSIMRAKDLGLEVSVHSIERLEEANAQGFRCVMGLLGILALYPEVKSRVVRFALALSSPIVIYGLILSASRSALVVTFATIVIWPFLCFSKLSQSKWTVLLIIAAIFGTAYWSQDFIIEQTNLGRRFMFLLNMQDSSSEIRLELILLGLNKFLEYPITGVGLGHFGVASGTDSYAHNELVEILTTTGLVGALLYYYAYLTTWRRLSRSLRNLHDPIFLYRVNFARMILILLLIAGFSSRPNFLGQDTMFLYAVVVGISLSARRLAIQASQRVKLQPFPDASSLDSVYASHRFS